MIDINKKNGKLVCPNCKNEFSVSIQQFENEESFKCDCGQEITLKRNETLKKSIDALNDKFKNILKK